MDGIPYFKPLSLADQLLIDTVTRRFEGVEAAFVAWDRGTYIELKCPEKIRFTAAHLDRLKSEANDAKKITAQEVCGTSGLSNG